MTTLEQYDFDPTKLEPQQVLQLYIVEKRRYRQEQN